MIKIVNYPTVKVKKEYQNPFELEPGIYDFLFKYSGNEIPGPFLVFGGDYAMGFCSLTKPDLFWRREQFQDIEVRVIATYDAEIKLTEKD